MKSQVQSAPELDHQCRLFYVSHETYLSRIQDLDLGSGHSNIIYEIWHRVSIHPKENAFGEVYIPLKRYLYLVDITMDPEGHRETLEKMGKELAVAELLNWWRQERRALLDALIPLTRKARLRWYGPPMSALSFATARLTETWAHGQDVADALGIERVPTDRLRHIAHLGVATFGWSYTNRQMKVKAKTEA